jgi:DNA-binding NtrC family response regulator
MSADRLFSVLAVDDDALFVRSIGRIFRGRPYTLITADSADQALTKLALQPIDLILLDLRMPGRDGMSLLEDLKKLYPDVPVMMLTGYGNIDLAVRAIHAGAADFLEKPCEPGLLLDRIAIHHRFWAQRISYPPDNRAFDFPGLIGKSPAMQRLKNLILRVAASDASVLIEGESGSGKELVAKAIHRHSPRQAKVLCAVDCAALNESLLESELFGHEKGAFTGAEDARLGLIRSADKGTLFLDEIGEIPLGMQAKLLRTLQEREVRPVGGTKSQAVDVRIIAATNRNLEEEVRQGRFRSDLFFRVSAVPLTLPPLRERGADILLLAEHFLAQFDQTGQKRISDRAAELLLGHSWPGNVRELENVLRRALILAESNTLVAEDLPATLVLEGRGGAAASPADDSLVAYEILALRRALQKTANNRRRAAALLGIAEATLYRKLKEHGLS